MSTKKQPTSGDKTVSDARGGELLTGATGKLMEDWSESFVVNEAEATMMYNWLYGAAKLAEMDLRARYSKMALLEDRFATGILHIPNHLRSEPQNFPAS